MLLALWHPLPPTTLWTRTKAAQQQALSTFLRLSIMPCQAYMLLALWYPLTPTNPRTRTTAAATTTTSFYLSSSTTIMTTTTTQAATPLMTNKKNVSNIFPDGYVTGTVRLFFSPAYAWVR
jgi:hypothetical protein